MYCRFQEPGAVFIVNSIPKFYHAINYYCTIYEKVFYMKLYESTRRFVSCSFQNR